MKSSNISHDNFLKTGDNNIGEYTNLAGHVTNFVDNEISLDFLQSSNGVLTQLESHNLA